MQTLFGATLSHGESFDVWACAVSDQCSEPHLNIVVDGVHLQVRPNYPEATSPTTKDHVRFADALAQAVLQYRDEVVRCYGVEVKYDNCPCPYCTAERAGLVDDMTIGLSPGDRVVVTSRDGWSAWGTVTDIRDGLVYVQYDGIAVEGEHDPTEVRKAEGGEADAA